MKHQGKGTIDTTMMPAKPVGKLDENPGIYDKHPNLGPAKADGGVPLKFFETSIDVGKAKIPGPSMEPTPADVKSS